MSGASPAKRQQQQRGGASANAKEEEGETGMQPRPGVPPQWARNIAKVLFDEATIQTRVRELAKDISASYGPDDDVVAVGLLNGAVIFMTDLVRHLTVPYVMDFMAVSSYRGTSSTGSVQVKKDLSLDPTDKHLLIVEDIVDSGATLSWLRNYLLTKKCRSVKVVCLLDKKVGRKQSHADVVVDFVGFECPDKFVVGYGLDFSQRYRGLPFVGVLRPEAYQAALEEDD